MSNVNIPELRDQYSRMLKKLTVKSVQIDPNGFCGSKCIYCCVRYIDRPPTTQIMSPESFDNILSQVVSLPISEKPHIWLSSYNDILLDLYLEDRLKSMRNHGLTFVVLSNGLGLRKNLQLLDRYKDIVISGYSFNIPAGNSDDYYFFTHHSKTTFDNLIQDLHDLYNLDPEWYGSRVNITVNGSYSDIYGKLQLKYTVPDHNTELQLRQLKDILPYSVSDARPLCDRAGNLREFAIDNSVMPIREWWKLPINSDTAIGCNGGSRLLEWVHVTNSSDLITCCQDYNEYHMYGNLKYSSLYDLLVSDKRVDATMDTLKKLCTKCWFSY